MSTQVVNFKSYRTKSGWPTVTASIDGQPEFFLHSTVDPVREAKDWLARIELTDRTAYLILGFGLGYHVKALLEELPPDSHIYVVDHARFSLISTAKNSFPDSSWLADTRLSVSATEELRELGVALAGDMSKRYINKVTLCRYYPSMLLAPEFYRSVETELVANAGELFCLNFNNRITLGMKGIENSWLNVPYILSSPGIKALAGRFTGLPAIIVAAGPSLNKNIEILKKCTDRAVVIAAGSTMGALYTQGITPCFLAAVDAGLPMYEGLEGVVDPETILLASYDVHPKVVSEYPGKRMFIFDQRMISLQGVRPKLPETDLIQLNISVATTAMNFALYCGANPIIFVGQDLSYSADAHHAEGVKAGDFSGSESHMTFVPGYDGGEVPTVFILRDVIQYYESVIKLSQGVSFINATEGGARITGTRQMKLSEVYEQFLQKTISIDSIIDEVYSQFIVPNYTEMLDVMLDIKQEIKRMQEVTDTFTAEILKEIDETLEWQQKECERLQTRLESFFKKLPQYPIYKDIEPIMAPLQELVDYRLREGISFQQKVEVYVDLINNLQVVLRNLDCVLEKAIGRIEKMRSELAEQMVGKKDE